MLHERSRKNKAIILGADANSALIIPHYQQVILVDPLLSETYREYSKSLINVFTLQVPYHLMVKGLADYSINCLVINTPEVENCRYLLNLFKQKINDIILINKDLDIEGIVHDKYKLIEL